MPFAPLRRESSLIDVLDRLLDKGLLLERRDWLVGAIEMRHIRVVVRVNDDGDDDGGGDAGAAQRRSARRQRVQVIGPGGERISTRY